MTGTRGTLVIGCYRSDQSSVGEFDLARVDRRRRFDFGILLQEIDGGAENSALTLLLIVGTANDLGVGVADRPKDQDASSEKSLAALLRLTPKDGSVSKFTGRI